MPTTHERGELLRALEQAQLATWQAASLAADGHHDGVMQDLAGMARHLSMLMNEEHLATQRRNQAVVRTMARRTKEDRLEVPRAPQSE